MSTSSRKQITPTTVTTWDNLIGNFAHHIQQKHPTTLKNPACENCYPISRILDTTWNNFFEWYKTYFNATSYSAAIVERYQEFKQSLTLLHIDINSNLLRRSSGLTT